MSPLPLISRESLKAKTSMSTAKYGRDNQPNSVLKKDYYKSTRSRSSRTVSERESHSLDD